MSSTTVTSEQKLTLESNPGASATQPQDGPAGLAAVTTGEYEFPGIPKIDDPYKKRQWQLEHMAGAFRVFARRGYGEGTSGHISVRDPVDPSTFWINPMGVHFGMLKASDMVHVDEKGRVIGGNKVAVNAAGFIIHSAIHKARPDINAACHTHSKYGKAWASFGLPLDIISQDTCNFYGIQAVYDDFNGIVLGDAESLRIADVMGEHAKVVILQNHGLLTAGGTVDEAAYLFTLMERSCEVQLMVDACKHEKKLINEEAARFTAKVNADPETLYTEFQPDFEYEIWKSKGELSKGE
ncbi:unnamed protein product [Clonostachys solani]|uniref:Class II aldolase/adducin N-terminal domain-containing protein n=1 Tax=Clonostachys solani TaxID=160281 RepID=A0A9N9ZFP9_9HYPO|nr:unnamed protein product [Clonostachys solani]